MSAKPSHFHLISQLITVILVAASFYGVSRFARGTDSFMAGMVIYWTILLLQIYLAEGKSTMKSVKSMLTGKSTSLRISSMCYLPSALVFITVFRPHLSNIHFPLLLTTTGIGLLNGLLEEIYWRGQIYRMKRRSIIISSTMLFAANHASFLFFSIDYQGGALNLIGGPLIMGTIWMFAAVKTESVKHGVFAHQIVNALAFYTMFATSGTHL